MLADAAAWLDLIGLRAWAGGEPYAWINSVHLLGLVMLVGGIGVVDIRLTGAWRTLDPLALSSALTPVAVAGLAISLTSGALLFAADGATLAGSQLFARKLVLVAAALANAGVFRLLYARRLAEWRGAPPPAGRMLAMLSLALWLSVGLLGRLIAYR